MLALATDDLQPALIGVEGSSAECAQGAGHQTCLFGPGGSRLACRLLALATHKLRLAVIGVQGQKTEGTRP